MEVKGFRMVSLSWAGYMIEPVKCRTEGPKFRFFRLSVSDVLTLKVQGRG